MSTFIFTIVISVIYQLNVTSTDAMGTMNAQGVLQMELSRAIDSLSGAPPGKPGAPFSSSFDSLRSLRTTPRSLWGDIPSEAPPAKAGARVEGSRRPTGDKRPPSYQTYTQSSTTMILQVPSITTDANGNVRVIANAFDYLIYTYDSTAGTLQRIVDANDLAGSRRATAQEPDDTRVVARYLSGVTFTYSSKDVAFTLSGSKIENRRTFSAALSARARFRNASG